MAGALLVQALSEPRDPGHQKTGQTTVFPRFWIRERGGQQRKEEKGPEPVAGITAQHQQPPYHGGPTPRRPRA